MSDFFERNRPGYYDALTRVRTSNDLIHWVCFFLNGVEQTAIKGRDVFHKILKLQHKMDEMVGSFGKRTPLARNAMKLLYRQPIVAATNLEKALKISSPTANAMIKSLVEKEVLKEITGQQRSRYYAFKPYLRLFLS